jgi:surface protein
MEVVPMVIRVLFFFEELLLMVDPVTCILPVVSLTVLRFFVLENLKMKYVRTLAGNVVLSGNWSSMFAGNTVFNGPVDTWDTWRVTNMSNIFTGARQFGQ